MKIIHEVTLDVARQGVQVTVPITQYDKGVHRLIVHLRNGADPVKIDNRQHTIAILSENNILESVYTYAEESAYPNCLVYDIGSGVALAAGRHEATFQIFGLDGNILFSPQLAFQVRENPHNGIMDSDEAKASFSAFVDATNEINAYLNSPDETREFPNLDATTVTGAINEIQRKKAEWLNPSTEGDWNHDGDAHILGNVHAAGIVLQEDTIAIVEDPSMILDGEVLSWNEDRQKLVPAGFHKDFPSEIDYAVKAQEYKIDEVAISAAELDYRVDKLERITSPYPFVEDNGTQFIKEIPSNTLPYAEIKKIYGNYNVIDGEIHFAKVTAIRISGANLFNPSSDGIHKNARIATSTGGSYGDSDHSISDYILVTPGKYYSISGTYESSYYAWYDTDKNFISANGVSVNKPIFAPSNAAYLRFDFPTGMIMDTMLNIGSVALPYASFYETYYTLEDIAHYMGYGECNPYDVSEVNYIDLERGVYVTRGYYSDGAWISSAVPIEEDVTWLFDDSFFNVIPNGSITFINEKCIPVKSEITYMMKEG